MRRLVLVAATALVCGAGVAGGARVGAQPGDWTQFGFGPAKRNVGPATTRITAANVNSLVRQQVVLRGTVDSSPLYARGLLLGGERHDVFFVQTTYGRVYAIDADSGGIFWEFTPDGYDSLAGTPRVTTASPALSPDRKFVYSASPDGLIRKLDVATGRETAESGWPVRVTYDPAHEKLSSPLTLTGNRVLATTSSFGGAPPYQGHLVVVDRNSGRIVNVWNALCSDRHVLVEPRDCARVDGAGIWSRAGVVVHPRTGNLLLATGNGTTNGRTRWGMSVVVLSPDGGRMLRYWIPKDWAELAGIDLDIGSTSPALVTSTLLLQGGKDGKFRLLDLQKMRRPPGPGQDAVLGGQLQTFVAPGGRGLVYTAPAVWRHDGVTWVFVSTFRATAGYVLRNRRLVKKWQQPFGATSPLVAGGLLYAYDAAAGTLRVYRPTSGRPVAGLPVGTGHWNTPIVADGRIAIGQDDANAWATSGVLNIYRLP